MLSTRINCLRIKVEKNNESLKECIKMNGKTNIIPVQLGLGAQKGTLKFNISGNGTS